MEFNSPIKQKMILRSLALVD